MFFAKMSLKCKLSILHLRLKNAKCFVHTYTYREYTTGRALFPGTGCVLFFAQLYYCERGGLNSSKSPVNAIMIEGHTLPGKVSH
jgi:hypothetical protein